MDMNRLLSELEDDDFDIGYPEGYGISVAAEPANPEAPPKGRKNKKQKAKQQTFLAKCHNCFRTYKTLRGYEGHLKSHKLSGKKYVLQFNILSTYFSKRHVLFSV